ncbi:hypothetical protein [Chryseobacterium viscerum]|uniref:Uncharacterized protein n=1 Tax=Chryseobacterium viscerum TaxID=1037377 RepID=A0A5N4BPY8_9FLAO|nr:hypothetical protein [Chryseobacterium viscerum]KAB1230175.1 hypothetical protein F8D52_13390 [Chryseobacterium viscerum]
MKNTLKNLFTFLLISFQALNAQSKVENFYNYDFQKISKEEFDKISSQIGYSYNQFETEDQIANILYQPRTKGKLKPEEYDSLKIALNKIAPLKNEFIIIIYYPGIDKCNKENAKSGWNIFDKDFKEEVNRLSINNIFWVYKKNEDLKYYYPRTSKWQKDENALIEKLFFKMHYPCFSSTTIDKNGNYISNLGEFGKQHVIQNIKELKSNMY